MAWEIVCPTVIVGWALLLWVLERRFPYDRQRFLREGFWTDLVGYTGRNHVFLPLEAEGSRMMDLIESFVDAPPAAPEPAANQPG